MIIFGTNVFVIVSAVLSPLAAAVAAVAACSNIRLRCRLRSTHAELVASRHAALRDPLTGLANRAGIDAHLNLRAASTEPVWLLLIDLDGFKPINDTYTHAVGDVMLCEVGRRLLHTVDTRRGLVGRLGGDEFTIISDAETPTAAAAHASRVVAELSKPVTVAADVHVQISASVGWVQMRPGDDPGAALHSADVAMYRAKAAGGGRVVAFDHEELLATDDERPSARIRDVHTHRESQANLEAQKPAAEAAGLVQRPLP